jgi:hypothetical protein
MYHCGRSNGAAQSYLRVSSQGSGRFKAKGRIGMRLLGELRFALNLQTAPPLQAFPAVLTGQDYYATYRGLLSF